MSSRSSLDELVAGAQEGRAHDVELLLAELRPVICRWAVVWTGSPDAAEDIAQTVLLRIHDSLDVYSPDAQFTTWAYRITRNALVDYDRAHGREDALRDRVRLEEVARSAAEDGGARALEAMDLLQHVMRVLTPQQRAALDLVELQGFTAVEAAEMLEVAPPTVRVHLHRAREAIRASLDSTAEPKYG